RENAPSATGAPTGTAEAGDLPALLTRVVGRDDVISRLAEQLVRCRFLTIVGSGGIGKTTVAIAVAGRVGASFKDGAWFVGLAPLSDPGLVPSAVGTALGVSPLGGDPTRALVAWLRDRSALLVLDNCEHVIGATAALAEVLLKAAPQAGILATSREPLRAEGEWLHRLASLELPPHGRTSPTAAEALRYPAVELFIERATATMDGFMLDDADMPAVLEICRRLDGVPLALELAAARVATLGIGRLAARLDNSLGVLTSGRRTALPRQQTLRATLDWSYRLLPDAERSLLRRLAVFPSSFTLDAAAGVMSDAGLDASVVANGIANLVAKSLVMVGKSEGATRWYLLETIRAYALEELRRTDEAEQTARLHAEYFRDLLNAATQDGASADRPGAALAPEIDNIRSALAWAFEHGGNASIEVALAAASAPVWLELSLLNECAGWMSKALARLDGADRGTRHEMRLQAALGFALLFSKGITREAYAALLKAADLAERVGDADYQLRTLSGLCRFSLRHRDFRGGLALARRYDAVAARAGDRGAWPTADWMLGFFLFCLGDLTGGRTLVERFSNGYQPRSRRSEIGRHGVDLRAYALSILGIIRWCLGFPEQAAQASRASVDEAHTLEHPVSLCVALLMKGLVSLWVGDLAAVQQSTASLLEHSKTHTLDIYYAHGLGLEGELAALRGDLVNGVRLLRTCLDDLRETEQYLFHSVFFGDLAKWVAAAGDIGESLAMIDDALESAERSEELWYLPEILRIKGELSLLRGATGGRATAEGLFRRALNGAHRQGALSWELRAATSLARLFRNRGRAAEARGLLRSVYDRFTEGFDTADLIAAKALLDAPSAAELDTGA
ncbi:MAG: transcriptional regulator, partial [Hyphomicrobiales bacterium]|nr:transcriptional regulator [Hyphomicrobiales bacterium]